ncbi:DUF6894 family protein [Sphingomonas faeni]|uniref:DUF6894 family protein n=1 Tax=Sphingomonas faeni TaxID=185950 RepID=UPI002788543F|nr:hypothetical protein [Sphingomonas faeni]MDQ0838681.1 hypothetical protein [Sphingomonas faeni]
MTTYSLNICDRTGMVLRIEPVNANDAQTALIEANRLFCRLASSPSGLLDQHGRIDVTDSDGRTVARLVMTESIAAMR